MDKNESSKSPKKSPEIFIWRVCHDICIDKYKIIIVFCYDNKIWKHMDNKKSPKIIFITTILK